MLTGYSLKRLVAFVRKYVRRAQLVEDNSTEIIFQLPSEAAQDGYFEMLFEKLENCHNDLGILSYGISDTSLEEVYFFLLIIVLYCLQSFHQVTCTQSRLLLLG